MCRGYHAGDEYPITSEPPFPCYHYHNNKYTTTTTIWTSFYKESLNHKTNRNGLVGVTMYNGQYEQGNAALVKFKTKTLLCMSGALQYMTCAHKIKCSVLVYVTDVLWYSTITLTATERSMPGFSAFVQISSSVLWVIIQASTVIFCYDIVKF